MGLFKPDTPEKIAAKNEKVAGRVLASAQEAWDTSQKYFTPVFVQSAGMHTGGNTVMNLPEWPVLIEAVESVGWQLHTWQTVTVMPWSGPTAIGSVAAHPLFVRPTAIPE
ncbi:hypothetical protein [Microbacterium paraoxydans]|uniref:hypothetical protein n=1 Tax=Microbacterium paraoxydans TaxID=199592 RepID=UPI003D71E806